MQPGRVFRQIKPAPTDNPTPSSRLFGGIMQVNKSCGGNTFIRRNAFSFRLKGLFPADRYGPLQYGDDLKAFVINLLVGQIVSLNRVQKLVKSMIGVVIAEASLLKFVLRLH